MEKEIYQDENGLYFVEYDANGNLVKVYCDENGNPFQNEEAGTLEIFQQEDGTYYYVAYNELGEAYKVLCDENGNEIVSDTYVNQGQYAAGGAQFQQNNQTYNQQTAAGVGAGAAAYAGQQITKKKSSGLKAALIGLLVLIPLLLGGYYAYSTFIAKPIVKMSGYEVNVKFNGKDGEGKAEAQITAIPNVKISDATKQTAVDDLLTNANITYSENSGLSNGDKIAVNIDVDPAAAEGAGVKLEGTYRKTVTVEGLEAASSKSSSSSDEKKDSSSDEKKESSSDEKKESSSDEKKAEEPKRLEYKQVYNTGYKGLLMRTGPSQSYPAIRTLFDGTPVQILEYSGSWAKVDYNGTQGWMYTGYLR